MAYIIEQGNTEAFNGFVNLLNDKKIKAADLDMYIAAAKNNEVLTEALLEYKNTNYLA